MSPHHLSEVDGPNAANVPPEAVYNDSASAADRLAPAAQPAMVTRYTPYQVDYRTSPSASPAGDTVTQGGSDYDSPNTGGFHVPPMPDKTIRSFDLASQDGFNSYTTLIPGEPAHAPGVSPDAASQLAWERSGDGGPKC